MTSLERRVAIVTGGANGIGEAYAGGLAREGARVYVADIDEQRASEVAASIGKAGGSAQAILVDIASESSVANMTNSVVNEDGRIDILVNNAGIIPRGDERVATEDLSVDEWDRMMAVNLRGTFLCSRAVIAPMREAGSGCIVNISSGTWYHGAATRIHYVTSKAGELGPHGIRVNCIAPGGTLSEKDPSDAIVQQREKAIGARAIKRVQYPEDLVGALLFLAADASSFITGQTIVVDGGTVMI
jgi:3-oxoacyl-[acyl-carrier protein] reductase